MLLEPYLFFEGRCAEAVEFYKSALGAELEMFMHYKDSPDPSACGPGMEDKVMHASIRIGQQRMMLSDGRCDKPASFSGFSLSLSAADATEADRLFTALGKGGQVHMPLTETFFSPRFGMVADRFGVLWMVIVPSA